MELFKVMTRVPSAFQDAIGAGALTGQGINMCVRVCVCVCVCVCKCLVGIKLIGFFSFLVLYVHGGEMAYLHWYSTSFLHLRCTHTHTHTHTHVDTLSR